MSGVQVIARAAAVLRAMESEDCALSLGEIARRVALPRSTVQRIVRALAEERMLMSTAAGHVRLGPALTLLAAGARHEAVESVRPLLLALSRELDETVDFSVPARSEVVFVDHVVAARRLRLVSDVGVRFPAHCTANGKALLARMDDDAVRRALADPLPAATHCTVVSVDALVVELDSIRRTGLAYDREEHTAGICAVGVAVADRRRLLGAISVPVPASRFNGSEARIAQALCSKLAETPGGLRMVVGPTSEPAGLISGPVFTFPPQLNTERLS